jgi:hypothetical protein
MSLFANLKSDGLEKTEDRVGGFQPLETDAYTGTIKAFYATKSQGGANAVNVILALEGGKEYRETIYVTNRNGENFYLNQNDKTKKVPLPGFVIAEDICLVTVDKPLSDVIFEDKVMNIYDPEAKREVPKSVPMATELLGKEVTLGIVKQTVNKNEKAGDGSYVPTADTRDENFTDKVFHTGTKMTTVEARNGSEGAVFFNTWVERNKGNTRDKRTIKDGQASNAGQAGRPGGGAPAAGAAGAAPKKSLFGG